MPLCITVITDNADMIPEDHDIASLPAFNIHNVPYQNLSVFFEEYDQVPDSSEIDVDIRFS